jgi:DNA-binding LytR/AlgR family response regulator
VPFVVFVTAYDQYALKAFDVNAVDYLLKPYDDDRFFASLEKAKRTSTCAQNSKLTGKLMDLMREHMHANSELHRAVRDQGQGPRAQGSRGGHALPACRGQLPAACN